MVVFIVVFVGGVCVCFLWLAVCACGGCSWLIVSLCVSGVVVNIVVCVCCNRCCC